MSVLLAEDFFKLKISLRDKKERMDVNESTTQTKLPKEHNTEKKYFDKMTEEVAVMKVKDSKL